MLLSIPQQRASVKACIQVPCLPPFLSPTPQPNMTEEECQAFVVKAVSHAMARDGSSGGCIRTVVISKDGVKRRCEPGWPRWDGHWAQHGHNAWGRHWEGTGKQGCSSCEHDAQVGFLHIPEQCSFLPGDRVPVAFGELPAPQQQPQVQA